MVHFLSCKMLAKGLYMARIIIVIELSGVHLV